MQVLVWIIWFQCLFGFWIVCTLFQCWDDFQIQIWMRLICYVRHNMCCCVSMLLCWKCYLIFILMDLMFQLGLGFFYFDFSIIKRSSCSAQVHSFCAPLYPFQMSNIGKCNFSFFSNILKLSWKFQEFLNISQNFLNILIFSQNIQKQLKFLKISQFS